MMTRNTILELLKVVEADAEALKSTGRADPDAKPSYLAELIGKLIKEFGGMFRGGFGGFLQSREGEDDDDTEDSDEEDDGDSTEVSARSSTGVRTSSSKQLRKKKKNKEGIITKIVRFVKYIVYVLTLYFMIHTAIAMFNSFLMFKMVAAIMWAVAIFALKVWILHKGSGDQVVVHEDVHHEHHYENDDHYDHVPVDDWSSYSRKDYAHNLAYREQKPTPSSGLLSWFN
ncbi:uncharacterized protein LOC143195614 isoform X6 [Rhynchophorus ferrugineus]|uniref:uncharacterized protein LOC143195614 isoform X6 n=1 Tax=Rhynchophorus ferrugineus TaxID=354439 RepID=UPI003FCD168B